MNFDLTPQASHSDERTQEATPEQPTTSPRIIERSAHPISRKDISEEALKVLNRLSSLGFKGYLVGGGVRDLYLGKKPKDFDVGTDAKPSRLKRIFRNCRVIGRRFRIAHVFFPGEKIVEVATFRRGSVTHIPKESGTVVLIDNEYGTPEEDARRRDITINGLFYDIATHSIIDYVGGVEDLDNRLVRTINDPDRSFQEDPVRMVRTIRHAARTGFRVEENTSQAIYRNRSELQKANPSRLLEELFKDLRGGAAETFFRGIVETHLLDVFLPSLATQLREVGLDHPLWRRLRVLDRWSQEGREGTNSVLLSVLLHTVLLPEADCWSGERGLQVDIWRMLMKNFIECSRHLRISRRDAERVSQILIAFRKLVHSLSRNNLPNVFHKKPYLNEAFDFLEIEYASREEPVDLIASWRSQFAPDKPTKAERYSFGIGGFVGGGGEDGRRPVHGGQSRRHDRGRQPRHGRGGPAQGEPGVLFSPVEEGQEGMDDSFRTDHVPLAEERNPSTAAMPSAGESSTRGPAGEAGQTAPVSAGEGGEGQEGGSSNGDRRRRRRRGGRRRHGRHHPD